MILAVIGFIFVLAVLIYCSYWWVGTWYISWAMAGFHVFKEDWPVALVGTALLVVAWTLFFKYIFPLIHISL